MSELLNAIRLTEWGQLVRDGETTLEYCPWCVSEKRSGHTSDCRVGMAIAAAEADEPVPSVPFGFVTNVEMHFDWRDRLRLLVRGICILTISHESERDPVKVQSKSRIYVPPIIPRRPVQMSPSDFAAPRPTQ